MQMISMFWVRAYTDLPGFTFPCRAKGSGDSCYNKNDPLWNVPHQLTCAVTGGRLWWSHFLGFSASSFSRMCKGERSLLSPWRHLPQCCPFVTDWIPLNCKPKSTFSFLTMPFSDILLQQWNVAKIETYCHSVVRADMSSDTCAVMNHTENRTRKCDGWSKLLTLLGLKFSY